MFKNFLNILIGFIMLIFFSFIAWYEGSSITNISWEWKHSTPFTDFFNIEILNGKDIHYLDYFVYAAKYLPLFPVLMFISTIYIHSVLGIFIIKTKSNWTLAFWGLSGSIMLIMVGLISNPSTIGGRIFFWFFLMCGIIYVGIAIWFGLFKNRPATR